MATRGYDRQANIPTPPQSAGPMGTVHVFRVLCLSMAAMLYGLITVHLPSSRPYSRQMPAHKPLTSSSVNISSSSGIVSSITSASQVEASQWIFLDGRSYNLLQSREMDAYGAQDFNVDSKEPTSLPPLEYLKNYKNPCWYSVEGSSTKLRCVPYFFVAGVAKCGTTNLFHVLQRHHQVVPANRKELFWWDEKRGNFAAYLNLFSNATLQIGRSIDNVTLSHPLVTYDSTPSTFLHSRGMWHKESGRPDRTIADDIRQVIPQAKIIVTLRNPVTRLYSYYNHFKHRSARHFHIIVQQSIHKWKRCTASWSERYCAHAYWRRSMGVTLTFGMYVIFAADWLKTFPREQLHFIQLEEYQDNETLALQNIFKFLNLEAMREETDWYVDLNRNQKVYDIGPMFNTTRAILEDFYKPFNSRLAQLFGDDKWLW